MFTYSAVTLHEQVRWDMISRMVDLTIQTSLNNIEYEVRARLLIIEQTFLKSNPVVFSTEP